MVWIGAQTSHSTVLLLEYRYDVTKDSRGNAKGSAAYCPRKTPGASPAVFPNLYRNWNDSIGAMEPQYVELKTALELPPSKAPYLKFVILIDGVDEFEGDYVDMSTFLRSLTSDRVKLIVSSRLINACLDAFTKCPFLRLQDFTKRDLKAFVRRVVSSRHDIAALSAEHLQSASELASRILDRAEGVFLWVRVGVQLLVRDLQNGDNIREPQATLESLPSGLEDLYQRMFDSLPQDYRVEAALIFQLERL